MSTGLGRASKAKGWEIDRWVMVVAPAGVAYYVRGRGSILREKGHSCSTPWLLTYSQPLQGETTTKVITVGLTASG